MSETNHFDVDHDYDRHNLLNLTNQSVKSRATRFDSTSTMARNKRLANCGLYICERRVVKFTEITKGMSVLLILAQLSGGALQKLIYHEEQNDLEVYFLSKFGATDFIGYD